MIKNAVAIVLLLGWIEQRSIDAFGHHRARVRDEHRLASRSWVTPGGGLNSRVSNWPSAVFNAMEAFKNDFRCITMDQRNANGGESTGPVPVDSPWDAFADDQLGLMDHLGIREFFYIGYCIGSTSSWVSLSFVRS
jgi:pimeloyl-ACP methyl ester carboxylesterase